MKRTERETADRLMERVFEKYYAPTINTKTAQDFVFKVAGLKEFISGDIPITSFE